MNIKIIAAFTFLQILTSCNNKVVANFEITNRTAIKIDSLKIEATQISKGKSISIKPNEKTKYEVDMSGIAKVDGSYTLSYWQNEKKVIKYFGYYTNGYPLEKKTQITIEKDSVKFDPQFGKF